MTFAAAALPSVQVHRRTAMFATLVLLGALFVCCHPYIGIRGDATIYMMRALADLDPAGLGRDLMVVDDGQMRFSLFPLMLRPMVTALGAPDAAMLVAGLGSAAWFAALAALAWRLAPGRIAWAMVAMVAVLPLDYGDKGIFCFAETSATPRPLAEAAVMAALAAVLARRWLPASLALAFATLIHPIMAAAGVGVVALCLLWRLPMRGQIAVISAAIAAILLVAALGWSDVAPFDRLLARPDVDWLAMLHMRSPHLFPTLWTAKSFSPLLSQAATILVAAHHAAARQRRLLVAALVVCFGGLAIEAVLGDTLHLLLFIQTQAWRATWLVAVLGGCALAFCVGTLWLEGPRARVVLALVALAWFFQPAPTATIMIAGAALGLEFAPVGRLRMTATMATVAVLVSATLSLLWAIGPLVGYLQYLHDLPAGDAPSTLDPLRNNLQSLPLCAVIAGWLVGPAAFVESTAASLALSFACFGLLAVDALAWDQRSAAQAYLEDYHPPSAVLALAAGRRQDVFWVDSRAEAWFALRRPQYFSPQQAVSIVFSRTLSREWTRRANGLIELGLVPKNVFTPWKPAADDDRERVTQGAINTLCARPDAPGLVVVPRTEGVPNLRGMIDWPLPAPLFRPTNFASGEVRLRIDGFAIVPCAGSVLPR